MLDREGVRRSGGETQSYIHSVPRMSGLDDASSAPALLLSSLAGCLDVGNPTDVVYNGLSMDLRVNREKPKSPIRRSGFWQDA